MANFITWNVYYYSDFIKMYNEASQKRDLMLVSSNQRLSQQDIEILVNIYTSLFGMSCDILKLYLTNNGIFQFDTREIIKESYYIEFIKNGEEWMNGLDLYEKLQSNDIEQYLPEFLNFYTNCFYIFEDLKNTFKNMVKDYDDSKQNI